MKYYDMGEEQNKKIPYDKEPIIRQTNYKKTKVTEKSSGKGLAFLVAILIMFNAVLGYMVFSTMKNGSGDINNTTVNIQSPSAIDVSAVASKTKLSVVCVHAGYTTSSSEDPNYQGFFHMSSKGSGVIIQDDKSAGDAYILTCYHVVKKYKTQVYVLLYDSFSPIKAEVVSFSYIYDTAVLKIDNSSEYKKSGSSEVDVADSSLLLEGDGAVAVGNPLGAGISVTNGSISKTVDLVSVDGIVHRVIRTSAAINNGNSGGGLFDAKGRFIGLVNAKAGDNPSSDKYIDNIAYAIPSNVVIKLAKNIIQRNDAPVKASLGVKLLVKNEPLKFDVINGRYIPKQTVVIDTIETSSTAYNAGVRDGDILTGFTYNGTVVNVTNIYSIDDHAFAINKGDSITFHIVRNNQSKDFTFIVNKVVSADAQEWY